MSIQGTLAEGDFTPLGGGGFIQVAEETMLGMTRKGLPARTVVTTFYIDIQEEGFVARKPAAAALMHLANAATYAIKLFDGV